MAQPVGVDAIIIAGGRANRLGGIDKTALVFNGRSLLGRALDAVGRADRITVVGHDLPDIAPSDVEGSIRRIDEVPRWGGPAAAVVAGASNLADEPREFTIVIAADLPLVGRALTHLSEALERAIATGAPADGVIAVDSSGHPQPLLAIYRTAALTLAADAHSTHANLSMRALIEPLNLTAVPLDDELCADVDTPEDADSVGIRVFSAGGSR